MTDASGRSEYSKVVTATVKGNGSFFVEAYPNPVTDMLTVKAYGTEDANATITVMDVAGKVLKMVSVTNNTAQVNMKELASGIYFVKYSDNKHSETIRINRK